MTEGERSLTASRAIISKRKRVRVDRKKRSNAAELPSVSLRSVEELETELDTGAFGANALPALLTHVRAGDSECVRAIHSARRALADLEKYASGEPTFAKWHDARRRDLHIALARIVTTKESADEEIENAIVVCALSTGTMVGWTIIVRAALMAPDYRAIDIVSERFVMPFADLRQTALRALVDTPSLNASYALTLVLHCNNPPKSSSVRAGAGDSKSNGVAGVKESDSLRAAYGDAWLRVLGSELAPEKLSDALRKLPEVVLPRVRTPLSFADSLTRCYDAGVPMVAVAALDGLFYLISKHGLDYPLFYTKLYNLFTPDALWGDGSLSNSRFLIMAAKFLRFGVFIPSAVVSAFVKRLTRRALHAPPERALWCLRLALDLLHAHPSVCYLVHRSVSLFDSSASAPVTLDKGVDPYDDEALDPADSGATSSSLWELDCLRTHISPAVSCLVESFNRDVRKKLPPPPGNVDDYAELTFADIFQGEFRRRAKSTPIAYDAPGCAPGVREVENKLTCVLSWS